MTGRPRRIPDKGDVPPKSAAQRLGLSLADFELRRPELERRGFPPADPTTGNYCIEAVDKWRADRHRGLLSETQAAGALNAQEVYREKRRAVFGQG